MNPRNFFAELKRRNVYKVAVAYAVVAWLLIQAASILFPTFEAPPWVMKVVVAMIVLGFPIALILAWAFEITPEGIKRAEDVTPEESITGRTGRKLLGITVALAVLAAGLLAWQLLRPKPVAPIALAPAVTTRVIPEKSIAVLPFDNLSEDKANAYFAEGVQDEILTRLAKVADLKVISRTSTQRFKSAPENLPEIAKQLGVSTILEGSVQKSGDQVRVNVQLIHAASDAHLWADTFDRKLTDIFAVESEIAQTIAERLQAKLTGSEKILLAKKPTENPEAYELYLKGRFFWNKRTAADLRKSIDYFRQAIAKDPDYALAYAALAQAWILLPAHNAAAPKDCAPPAEEAIRKALALDETSSDAHAAFGELRAAFQFDFAGATAEFGRAIQLNPNDATARHWSGMNTGALGNIASEVAEMRRAAALDPLSLIINTNLGRALIDARRFDEAIAQLHKTIEMDASFSYAHRLLGLALELQGKSAEAIAAYEKAISLGEDVPAPAMLGHLYGTLGRKEEATKILRQLQAESEHRYVDPYWLAIVYVGLGDREHALAALEQGYAGRSGDELSFLRIDTFFDPLRDDPRFQALAEKIVPAREFGQASPALK